MWLAIISLVFVLITSADPARACSCAGFQDWGFTHPDDGALPKNARGLLWWGRSDPAKLATESPAKLRIQDLAEGRDLEVESEQIGEAGLPLWMVRPRGGLEVGKSYRFIFRREIDPYSGGMDEQRVEVNVVDTELVRPSETKIALGKRKVAPLTVAAFVSCYADVDAAQVSVTWEFPEDLQQFAGHLYYETLVDGRPWRASRSLCSPPAPGMSWQGPGKELLYSLCGDPKGAANRALEAGPHRLSMRATLPGSSIEIVSPEVDLNLVCKTD
jgi:hypothetical protein